MQIVFQPEELWGAKAKIKDQKNHHRNFFCLFFRLFFFSNFIYIVIGVLNTTETRRNRGTTRRTQYRFPLNMAECHLWGNFHVCNWREMCTNKKKKKGFLQCERQGLLSWQPGLQLGQVWITNCAICSELLQPVAAAFTLQPCWPRLSTEISWWGRRGTAKLTNGQRWNGKEYKRSRFNEV